MFVEPAERRDGPKIIRVPARVRHALCSSHTAIYQFREGKHMSIRSGFAAALLAATVPLAAPVAAHAESNDCVVLSNYNDNILNLLDQDNSAIDLFNGTDISDADGKAQARGYIASAAQTEHALASQLRGAAARLISPTYKQLVQEWAEDEEAQARYRADTGNSVRSSDTVKARANDAIDRLQQDAINWDNARDGACAH
jgi:hypothetical protein